MKTDAIMGCSFFRMRLDDGIIHQFSKQTLTKLFYKRAGNTSADECNEEPTNIISSLSPLRTAANNGTRPDAELHFHRCE